MRKVFRLRFRRQTKHSLHRTRVESKMQQLFNYTPSKILTHCKSIYVEQIWIENAYMRVHVFFSVRLQYGCIYEKGVIKSQNSTPVKCTVWQERNLCPVKRNNPLLPPCTWGLFLTFEPFDIPFPGAKSLF